jgi:hypothetical protein
MARVLSVYATILMLSLIFTFSLEAGVFKWVDDNGKVHYSDQPNKNSGHPKTRVLPSPNASPKTALQHEKKREEFGKTMEWLINPKGRIHKCQNLPESLERCVPYSCEMSHPLFGRFVIDHTISGMKDGKCHYEQTMPNNGLMTCNLSEKQRNNFAQLNRDMFSGKSIESKSSANMEGAWKWNSDGKTKSYTKVTNKKTSYKVDGKETKNMMNEALENGDCVITGY